MHKEVADNQTRLLNLMSTFSKGFEEEGKGQASVK